MTGGDRGAIPLVKLAELDSDMHHVREQADVYQRQQAQRWIDMRVWQDKTTEAIDTIKLHLAAQSGSISFAKWLVGLVGLAELGRFILEAHK